MLLCTGTCSFRTLQNFATGVAPYSVSINDLDGDGKLDLSVVNYRNSSVSVLLGNGTGTFRPRQDFATGARPTVPGGRSAADPAQPLDRGWGLF